MRRVVFNILIIIILSNVELICNNGLEWSKGALDGINPGPPSLSHDGKELILSGDLNLFVDIESGNETSRIFGGPNKRIRYTKDGSQIAGISFYYSDTSWASTWQVSEDIITFLDSQTKDVVKWHKMVNNDEQFMLKSYFSIRHRSLYYLWDYNDITNTFAVLGQWDSQDYSELSQITLWNGESGKLIKQFEQSTDIQSICSISSTPYFAICDLSASKPLMIINGETGEVVKSLAIGCECLTSSPDGRFLSMIQGYSNITVIRTSDWKIVYSVVGRVETGHCGFSYDGNLFAHMTKDSSKVNIVDTETGKIVKTIHTPQLRPHNTLFAQDGKSLICVEGKTGCAVKYNVDNDTKERTLALPRCHSIQGMQMSPDGKYIAIAWELQNSDEFMSSIGIIETSTGELVSRIITDDYFKHDYMLDDVHFDFVGSTGRIIVSGSSQSIYDWNFLTGEYFHYSNASYRILDAAISADESYISFTILNRQIKLINSSTFEEINTFTLDTLVSLRIGFTENNDIIAFCVKDRDAYCEQNLYIVTIDINTSEIDIREKYMGYSILWWKYYLRKTMDGTTFYNHELKWDYKQDCKSDKYHYFSGDCTSDYCPKRNIVAKAKHPDYYFSMPDSLQFFNTNQASNASAYSGYFLPDFVKYNNIWLPESTSEYARISYCEFPKFIYPYFTKDGRYVLVLNHNGGLMKFEVPEPIGIVEETAEDSELYCYPNPAHDFINIDISVISEENVISVEIYDLYGGFIASLLPEHETVVKSKIINIYLGDLSAGCYILRITTNKQILNKRFIKLDN